jgi:hypothetical protein
MIRNFILAVSLFSIVPPVFAGDVVMDELRAGLQKVYTDCMNATDKPECCYPFGSMAGVLKEKPNWQEPEYCRKGKTDSKNGSPPDSVMTPLNAQLDALYSKCLKSGPKECCESLKDHTKAIPASCHEGAAKKPKQQQGFSRASGAQ